MPITKEDKILIKNFALEGYNAESFLAKVERRPCLQVVAKAAGDWVGRPSSWQRQTMQRLHS